MSDNIEDVMIALSDLAEIPVAVTVESYRKKVDPHTIGRAIAGWNSDQQAAFLTGLSDGFHEIGPNYGLQLTYVGYDLAKMPDQVKTRYFLEVLASYLKEALTMPKQTYQPTEADRLTGANVRRLRRAAGETLLETLDRSGLDLGQSSLSRIELGERHLSLPEATKLAAHFGTTADRIIARRDPIGGSIHTPQTEQEWLGNPPTELFAVPDHITAETVYVKSRTLEINLDQPLTLAEYREQVWVPYLEARYSADLKAS